MIKFTCKKVEDKRTDVSTQTLQRPELDENLSPEEVNDQLNLVRMEIIRRQYG
jgi:hypothetical protein